MKFWVRGKSVDFKNREGSSPSIPKRIFLFSKLITNFFLYEWLTIHNHYYYWVFPKSFFYLVDKDLSHFINWRWFVKNGRDSSAGRAEDWKSSCHQFKSGSWHIIYLYEYLLPIFIWTNFWNRYVYISGIDHHRYLSIRVSGDIFFLDE